MLQEPFIQYNLFHQALSDFEEQKWVYIPVSDWLISPFFKKKTCSRFCPYRDKDLTSARNASNSIF